MRIKLKDIKSNPFRDMKLYELNQRKIQDLRSSIQDTGFWDNLVVRKSSNNKYQLAYGHHRFQALVDEYGLEHIIEIPVKDLDDETMLRIMARENEQDWQMDIKNVDETVRVTRRFLFDHQDIALKHWSEDSDHGKHLKSISSKTERNMFRSVEDIGSEVISRFLGGKAWYARRIRYSLERIDGDIDKKAVESLPSERTGRDFVRAVKTVEEEGLKVDSKTQRIVAQKIIESRYKKKGIGISGEIKIKHEIRKEITGKPTEKRVIDFETYLDETKMIISKLIPKIDQLIEHKDIYDSDHYRKSEERKALENKLTQLFLKFNELFNHDKLKLLSKGGESDDRRKDA